MSLGECPSREGEDVGIESTRERCLRVAAAGSDIRRWQWVGC